MSIEERIYNGDQAKLVLENEAFDKAFADIEQELTQAWKNSPQRDAEGREKLFLALTMLEKVRMCLTQTLQDGKLAMKELEHKRTLAERAKNAKSAFFSD